MKKSIKTFIALGAVFAAAFTSLSLTSCANAVVDDGNFVRSYVQSGSAAGGTGAFNMFNDKMDYQDWQGTTVNMGTSELVITPTINGWCGGCWCIDSSVNDDKATEAYDYSKLAKMKFSAKASEDCKFYFAVCPDMTKQTCSLTTDYQEFEVEVTSTQRGKHYALFTFGNPDGDTTANGKTITVKNIQYFDESGTEYAPQIVNK